MNIVKADTALKEYPYIDPLWNGDTKRTAIFTTALKMRAWDGNKLLCWCGRDIFVPEGVNKVRCLLMSPLGRLGRDMVGNTSFLEHREYYHHKKRKEALHAN